MRTLLYILLLVTSSALAQQPCPPGQICRVNPLPVRDWRASVPTKVIPGWRWDPGVPLVPTRPQSAAPTPRQVAVVNPAIVRVGSRYGRFTDYGTGTIINRRGKTAIVLTCWHTLRDGGAKDVFVVANGRRYHARVLHTDRTWDVAVLQIQDPGITPIAMATTSPIRGQTMILAGLGQGQGNYRQVSGQLQGYRAPQGATNFQWMAVAAGSRDGDSGGPVLYRGRVVGLVSTTSGYASYGPCLPRLRMILRAVLPPYPNRPGVIVPKPVVVVPVSPSVLPAPVTTDPPTIDYDKLAEAILKQLDLESLRGPTGLQGLPGNDGQTGDAGPTPAIDIDYLTASVLAKLFDEENPLLPPVVLEIHHPDGKVFTQAKPLGVPLRIRLVPVSE